MPRLKINQINLVFYIVLPRQKRRSSGRKKAHSCTLVFTFDGERIVCICLDLNAWWCATTPVDAARVKQRVSSKLLTDLEKNNRAPHTDDMIKV